MEDTRKQNDSIAAQLEAANQRKRDAERKWITLVRVLDEACCSLRDFDVQLVEELEQRLARLKDYAQQSHSEIEKLKVEHETQIEELQLKVHLRSKNNVAQTFKHLQQNFQTLWAAHQSC